MKNLSLYNKIFMIFLATILISVGLVGWFGIKSTSEAYLSSAYEISKQNTNVIGFEIERKLEKVPQDILYNSNFYALKRFLIWKTMGEDLKSQKWRQIYADALVDFLDTKKSYYKARVIALDGQEIISVKYDRLTDSTTLLSGSELQNKKGKSYVEDTKKLKKGEFYVSAMNLNVEHLKIQKPFIPVIRYATPIIDTNGDLVAIFVANIYAHDILDTLDKKTKEDSQRGIEYSLVDKDGNYLYNKDSSKRWNAQLKNGFNFNVENFNIKNNFADKESGTFTKNGSIYSFMKVHPLHQQLDNYWYIISSSKESVALSKLDELKLIFALILIAVIMISFFIVRTFVIKITNPISKVTNQLKALSNGEIQKENIIYDSNDEIGDIVNSTSKLIDNIESTIEQANAVANGDFSRDIILLGKNDALGLAIKNMTSRLKEITALASSLASGNYDVNIVAKSSDDKLGLALLDMVKYLKTITDIAESISMGELDVHYTAKGDEDRLGLAILEMIDYLRSVLKQANAISNGDFSVSLEAKSKNDELGVALVRMTDMLRDSSVKNKDEIFFSEGIGEFSDKLTAINDTVELAKEAITMACRYIGASSGVLYVIDEKKENLNLIASYAYISRASSSNGFKVGDGVVGQVALEVAPILLKNVKDDDYEVRSGTAVAKPKEVYTFPLVHEGELFGVAEVMSFESFTKIQKDYLSKASTVFAAALHTTSQNARIKELLEKSQNAFNELQVQSEELQESNIQMEEQQQQLTLQSKELKEKNEVLAAAKREIDKRAEDLEKASKYKSEFLANMSHELRTPLNSIILLSKLLTQNQNQTLDEKDVEKTAVINRAGNDLLLLINDILDLSKIESGHMELEYSSVSSHELITEIKGLFASLAEEKNIKFIIEDNFNSNFNTDKTKLLQVLKNLLSNAFKFTKDGSVSLLIHPNFSNNKLILEVKDSGIGIPSDKLDTIFEAFKQVDGSISREFGGTGLGLSISKTIVELMHGDIRVESVLGEGTSFIVTLALVEDTTISAPQVAPKSEEKSFASPTQKISMSTEDDVSFESDELVGKNILLVDDDSRNIFTLTSILENADAEVYNAFNGQEAIEFLEEAEHRIDLILMDIMMPIMDGLEAIKKLKSSDKYKKIPIIAVTAKNMPKDKQECLDAGADDYLSKPLDNKALVGTIKAWI